MQLSSLDCFLFLFKGFTCCGFVKEFGNFIAAECLLFIV